ncbi:Argonaute family protein [Melia azedarach]|uniref:Argonaute family protein n=1 Tax=Melia azedarach TaxID=155640 RepID=A0ACC1Z4L6_MELAZ|nr:Argonaute family protein [Melia azedarach]
MITIESHFERLHNKTLKHPDLPCLKVGKLAHPTYFPLEAVEVNDRILDTPKLVVGDNKELIPQNGCWNFINKSFIQVVPIRNWIIVSFCAVGFKLEDISHQLVNHGKYKHFEVNPAAGFYEEEDPDNRRNPLDRVEKMFHRIPPESYDFILCLAEEEKY